MDDKQEEGCALFGDENAASGHINATHGIMTISHHAIKVSPLGRRNTSPTRRI
jgi:hypothetical protein